MKRCCFLIASCLLTIPAAVADTKKPVSVFLLKRIAAETGVVAPRPI